MSIDYGFFIHQPAGRDERLVAQWYRNACEGAPFDAPTGTTAISSMVQWLSQTFPQLKDCSDEELDKSPWSSDFDYSDKHLIISVKLSHPAQVTKLLSDGHKQFGLVLYDPQSEQAFDPAGKRLVDPSRSFLRRLLGF